MAESVRGIIPILILLFLWLSPQGKAQSRQDASRIIFNEKLSAGTSEGWINSEQARSMQEAYEDFLRKPLDVNKASLEQLQAIPFLTEYHCAQLIRYRTDYRRIESLSELKLIPEWNDELCTLLYPLLSIQADSLHPQIRLRDWLYNAQSKLSLLSSYTYNLEKQSKYIGSPEAITLRYQCRSRDHFSLALGMQKDSYEPWSYRGYVGFDSYHGHIALHNVGILRRLIVGQYRASWGEGLILNQRFPLYRPILIGASYKQELSPIFGTPETCFSQGIAFEVSLSRNLSLTAISSWRRIDGKINRSTLLTTNLAESALHRTEQSLSHKWQVPSNHYGLQLALRKKDYSFALQTVHGNFGDCIIAHPIGAGRGSPLKQIKQFTLASLSADYYSSNRACHLSGEVAFSASGGIAGMLRNALHLWGKDFLIEGYLLSPYYWSYLTCPSPTLPYVSDAIGVHLGTLIPLGSMRIQLDAHTYRRGIEPGNPYSSEGYYFGGSIQSYLSKYCSSTLLVSKRRHTYHEQEHILLRLTYHKPKLRYSLTSEATHHSQDNKWGYACSLLGNFSPSEWLSAYLSMSYYSASNPNQATYIPEPRLSDERGITALYGTGIHISIGASYHASRHLHLGLRLTQELGRQTHPYESFTALQVTYQ